MDKADIHGQFVYDALSPDQKSIRLLRVLPASPTSDLLQCELVHATTSDGYTALSYTWGSSDDQRPILVNGKSILARPNLWDFLNRVSLTPDYTAKSLWIDALCINQADGREKSYQVARMGEIYENAQDVIIWLAPLRSHGGDHNSVTPICTFEHMASFLPREDRVRLGPQVPRHRSSSAYVSSHYVREHVCKHDYWDRLWIVQEFLLNPRRTLVYGSCAIPWEIFAAFQNFEDVARQQKQDQIFRGSLSSWITSPLSFISMIACQARVVKDYIDHEQAAFALRNQLLPSSESEPKLKSSLSLRLVQWSASRLPWIVTHLVSWRLSTYRPFMPSTLNTLLKKTQAAPNIRLATKSTFFTLLQSLSEQKCFDQRDKIYGLTALISSEITFPVNYELSTNQLYFRSLNNFTQPCDPSRETCSLVPQLIAAGLMRTLNLRLCDFEGSDPGNPSTNIVLVSATNPPATSEPSIACPNKLHYTPCGKTFRDCLRILVAEDHPVTQIPCSRCNTQVQFSTKHLANIINLQRLVANIPAQDPPIDASPVIGVMQCYQSLAPTNHPFSPLASSSAESRLGNIVQKPQHTPHLFLYDDPSSARPTATLDLTSTAEYDEMIKTMSTEDLDRFRTYIEQLSQSTPATYTYR